LQKLWIGNNPWQCPCLRETIIYARKNNVQLDQGNFLPPFPSCVVLPEDSCIRDQKVAEPFQAYSRYMDGVAIAEMETGKKRFKL
jgi:hypothetical protein